MLQNLLTKHRHFYKLILKQGSFKFQIYVLFESYPISIYKHYRLQGFLRMNIKWKTFENTRALALINKNTKMQTKWFAHYHFKWETLFSDSLSINPIPLLFKKQLRTPGGCNIGMGKLLHEYQKLHGHTYLKILLLVSFRAGEQGFKLSNYSSMSL